MAAPASEVPPPQPSGDVQTSAPSLAVPPTVQPGQLASQAAAVPAKQAPRPPSVATKTGPVPPSKLASPNTTPAPTNAEPKPPTAIKIEVPNPQQGPVVVTRPDGINPAARRLLSDTLPSGIAASSLRPDAVSTSGEPAKKPLTQAPPPAVKTVTVGADAAKKPAPAAPVAPPKPSAGRAALSALKAETPEAAPTPQSKTTPPPALIADEITLASAPTVPLPASVTAPKVIHAAAPPVESAPVSGPPRVGAVVLESIEALADLPTDVHKMLVRAATVEQIAPGEARVDFGAVLVVSGAVSIAAVDSDVLGRTFEAPAFIPSRGTLAEGLPLRVIGGSSGATIARWTSDFFEDALGSCSWVIDDCRALADGFQARAGLALGSLGAVEGKTRDDIVGRLDMRVLEPGEVVTEENGPMPGLVFVVAGRLELFEGEPLAIVGEVRAGEPLFAEALWAGAPATLTSRVSSSGAILLVADRKTALELAGEIPAVEELLSR
jgi:hypothetical protein